MSILVSLILITGMALVYTVTVKVNGVVGTVIVEILLSDEF